MRTFVRGFLAAFRDPRLAVVAFTLGVLGGYTLVALARPKR